MSLHAPPHLFASAIELEISAVFLAQLLLFLLFISSPTKLLALEYDQQGFLALPKGGGWEELLKTLFPRANEGRNGRFILLDEKAFHPSCTGRLEVCRRTDRRYCFG